MTTTVARPDCRAPRHDTDQAYRKSGCRCPQARTAEIARKAKYDAVRAAYQVFVANLRAGSYVQRGVPDFHWDPRLPCATVNPDVMFPELAEDVAVAQKICRPCPFRQACHQWAVDTAQAYGVWGGITEQQRRREIFNQRQQVTA